MKRIFLAALIALFIVSGCATAPVSHVIASDSATSDTGGSQLEPAAQETSAPVSNAGDAAENAKRSASESPALVGLTVEDAYAIAVANRPELAALQYRIAAAEGNAKQVGLWPNPVLTLGIEGYTPGGENPPPDLATLDNVATLSNRTRGRASALHSILFPDVPNPIPTYEWWVPSIPDTKEPDQLQQVVSIAQPLPLWGTPRLARKAGLLEVERWRREYERARFELESEVQQAFHRVVFQQERLAARTGLEGTLGEILEVTRARMNAGDIAESELIKGEADYERFRLEVETATADLAQAKIRLARVLGNPQLTVESCAGNDSSELPDLPANTVAKLRDDHPQVQVWEAMEDAAEASVAVAESKRWPVPTLGIGYRHYEYTDQDTFDVSLEFEVPLFDRKQGEIRAARERARMEMATALAERNDVDARLQETLIAFAAHRHRAMAYQDRILPRMEESLEIERASFEAGDTGILEVLIAYQGLAEARLAALHEIYETRAAYAELQYLLAM